VTVRPAYADDEPELRRLAALDSATVPRGPLLVAEVDGELRVAVAVEGLRAIADPFQFTSDLVALLREHIARLNDPAPARPRRRRSRPAWAA
jgi:hypothetical protein